MALVAVLAAIGGRATDGTTSASTTPVTPIAETVSAYLKPPVLVSTVPSLVARHQAEIEATAPPSTVAATAAAATATPGATPVPQAAYFTYTIQPGDSVASIAARFGINDAYLLWNNPELSADPDMLVIGGSLLVPSSNSLVYHVRYGDTLNGIAETYGITTDDILRNPANSLVSPDNLGEAAVLVLPGAVPPAPPAPVDTPAPEPAFIPAPVPAGIGSEPEPEPAAPPFVSTGFIWPFYSSISTYYGGYHAGIDIDGFNAYGAPISAAASGTVVLASWSDAGYGYHVIIDHGDGTQTLYAHLSEIWVSAGQWVNQGEGVGALGSTGYSTGPHLHFEIHVNGYAVDPLAYLP